MMFKEDSTIYIFVRLLIRSSRTRVIVLVRSVPSRRRHLRIRAVFVRSGGRRMRWIRTFRESKKFGHDRLRWTAHNPSLLPTAKERIRAILLQVRGCAILVLGIRENGNVWFQSRASDVLWKQRFLLKLLNFSKSIRTEKIVYILLLLSYTRYNTE